MFLGSVSHYFPFVYIRDLLPINFDSVSPECLYIPRGLHSCKYFSLCSEELRKEARQLKRELLEAKQKKEEKALKPKEKEGKHVLCRSPNNIPALKFQLYYVNEDTILLKCGFLFPRK